MPDAFGKRLNRQPSGGAWAVWSCFSHQAWAAEVGQTQAQHRSHPVLVLQMQARTCSAHAVLVVVVPNGMRNIGPQTGMEETDC